MEYLKIANSNKTFPCSVEQVMSFIHDDKERCLFIKHPNGELIECGVGHGSAYILKGSVGDVGLLPCKFSRKNRQFSLHIVCKETNIAKMQWWFWDKELEMDEFLCQNEQLCALIEKEHPLKCSMDKSSIYVFPQDETGERILAFRVGEFIFYSPKTNREFIIHNGKRLYNNGSTGGEYSVFK